MCIHNVWCAILVADRFPRCPLHKAFNSGSSSYAGVFRLCIANGRCYCVSVGSYWAFHELVLKHLSVIRPVCCTILLHYTVDLCSGKETVLQGISNLGYFMLLIGTLQFCCFCLAVSTSHLCCVKSTKTISKTLGWISNTITCLSEMHGRRMRRCNECAVSTSIRGVYAI